MSDKKSINNDGSLIIKKSHKEWRKDAKKLRRKKIRQLKAKERDQILAAEEKLFKDNPMYMTWLAEQKALELFKKEEEARQSQENQEKWLREELLAQKIFAEKQRKLQDIENTLAKERLRIKEEFEAEQKRIENLLNEKKRLEEEKQAKYDRLMNQIAAYIKGEIELPEEITEPANTNPNKPICPFFIKTGACRFGDKCSRNHCRPGVSKILLCPNFFTNIQLDQAKKTEYGNDSTLEYEDQDMVKDFLEFFSDVLPEFEKFGKLEQFRVCRNFEPHLRGNVYAEYLNQRDALHAYQQLQGRFYAGKQINVEFSAITSWPAAICGLSFTRKCPKGGNCNFLHVFKNPRNRFPIDLRRATDNRYNSINKSVLENANKHWNNEGIEKKNWNWSSSDSDNEAKPNTSAKTLKDKSRKTSSKARRNLERNNKSKKRHRSRKRNRSSSPERNRRNNDKKQRTKRSRSRDSRKKSKH